MNSISDRAPINDLDFVAIDFESANNERSSACAIGLAFVKDGVVFDTYYCLKSSHGRSKRR